ncbi:MAG: TerB family tellurite resistance protein [Alphaproteobacteria bacterium]|nr:TerB family tellurite resistance protein [Alphaproteobacteria bacterium]
MNTDLAVLRLVFSFHVVDQIMRADDWIDPLEIDWVQRRFPLEQLQAHGLVDDAHQLTDLYRELLSEALIRLPAELHEHQKTELALTFFDSAMADGQLEPNEQAQLEAAANLLGLPMARLHDALHHSDVVGEVDLGEPEV